MGLKRFALLLILFLVCRSAEALTRAQIRSQIKQLSVNEDNNYHPDSTLNIFIDRAINDVSVACSCVVKKDTVVTSVNIKEDTLNTDFFAIKSVYSKTLKTAIEQIPDKDVGNIDVMVDNSPSLFYINARRIGWEKTPLAKDSMFIWYFAYGKVLSNDTNTTDIPRAFENAIAYYALMDMYFRETEGELFIQAQQNAILKIAVGKGRMMQIPDKEVLPLKIPQ